MTGTSPLQRTLFFAGTHELLIDDKNRLLIPSQFRKKIDPKVDGQSLFVNLKLVKLNVLENAFIPWIYPEAFYRNMVNQQAPPLLEPSEEQQEYSRFNQGMGAELEWDNQGRVVLPEEILGTAALGKEVTLVGAQEHLELWNRAKWTAYRERLIANADAIKAWAQKSHAQPKSESKDAI
jgi:transcriptional regulator MraZ